MMYSLDENGNTWIYSWLVIPWTLWEEVFNPAIVMERAMEKGEPHRRQQNAAEAKVRRRTGQFEWQNNYIMVDLFIEKWNLA